MKAPRSSDQLVIWSTAIWLSGCDARLERPGLLWLLWLVPLLAIGGIVLSRQRQAHIRQLVEPETARRLLLGVQPGRRRSKAVLLLIAVTLLLISLAGLKIGFAWEEVRRQGVDIVVAIDVSDSMLVRDAEAVGELNRLERAKREVSDLLELLEGDRLGLVAFAGTAFLECPLTLDYGAAAIFLDSIAPDLIPVKGTALGEAIDAATQAFDPESTTGKAIILMTDGEDHQGEALAAAMRASEAGVRIFPIGIGRDEGAPIPDGRGGFRRDRSGDIILSRLDERALQKIALDTGGRYVRSVTGDVDLEQVYLQGIKATLEDQELGSSRQQRWKERFQWLVGAAMALLILERLIAETGRD